MNDYSKNLKESLSARFNMDTRITGKTSEEDAGIAVKRLYTLVGIGIMVSLIILATGVMFFLMK